MAFGGKRGAKGFRVLGDHWSTYPIMLNSYFFLLNTAREGVGYIIHCHRQNLAHPEEVGPTYN